MDWKKKITSDHTDVAYREAVSRLRTILSPRPQSQTSLLGSPTKSAKDINTSPRNLPSNPSVNYYEPTPTKKDRFTSSFRSIFSKDSTPIAPVPLKALNNQNYTSYMPITQTFGSSEACEDDLFGFIEKQGEYITQLEKETKYSRNELSGMLDKVRDVISENEALHEKQKRDLLTSMIEQLDEKTDGYSSEPVKNKPKSNISSNGNVIMESRLAELEAQLSQAKRNLRLAQEEVLEVRKGKAMGTGDSNIISNPEVISNIYANCDLHRSEIERLVREKDDLLDTMSKLKHMVSDLRDRESDAAKKVKNSLEIVEQMQMEKAQSDMETRRLKEELDRHQKRVRDMIHEHSRRLHEEKMQVEKKFRQEIDHLNNEMNQEMDSLTKARLDLERQKRVELDLKRELQQKSSTIEDLRQEMQIKLGHLQNELSHTLGQKSSVEQELINSRLNSEKVERDGKQEAIRLQAEISGLRRRLEQMDADSVKNQEIIVKLNENLAQLQREASLAKIRLEGHVGANPDMQEADVVNMIQNMEDKHSRDMTDLEQLIQVQNNLLEKLRSECKMLTEKLEETSRQYKEDFMNGLQSCVASFQNNLTSSIPDNEEFLEQQRLLMEELVDIFTEMNEWLARTESQNEVDSNAHKVNETKPVGEEEPEKQTREVEKIASDTEKQEGDDEKSKGDDEKPKGDTEKPDSDAEKPEVEAHKSDTDKEKPVEEADKADGDAEKPTEDAKNPDDVTEIQKDEQKEKDEPSEKENTGAKEVDNEADAVVTEETEKVSDDDSKGQKRESISTTKEDSAKISEDQWKAGVMELNFHLKDWARRIENVIERFSSFFLNKAGS